MSIIPDGVYRITKPNDQAVTVFAASAPPEPIRRIFLLPKTIGGEQDVSKVLFLSHLYLWILSLRYQWYVKNLSNKNVTIQNVVTKEYLGFSEKRQNELCEQTSKPVEWRLQPSAEEGKLQ